MEPEDQPPSGPERFSTERRLETWKEIADYLRREVRTVQRWEHIEGLPVHRLSHSKRGSIYAYPSELDVWRKQRELSKASSALPCDEPEPATKWTAPPTPEPPDVPSPATRVWKNSRMIMLAGVIVVLAAAWLLVILPVGTNVHLSPVSATRRQSLPAVDHTCAAPPALIHAWLAENGGADSIGSGNATLLPAVQIVSGVNGKAFSLDGRKAGLATTVQRLPIEFTLACWVRFRRFAHGPDVNLGMTPLGDMSILDKMQSGPVPNGAGWRLLKQEDNRIWFCLGGGQENRCVDPRYTLFSRQRVRLDTWYFLAVEKQAKLVRLYVNGELEDDRRLPKYTDSEAPLLLGWNAKYGAHLDGEIADVMVFGRPYGEAVIHEIYSAQADGRCPATAMVAQ